MSPHTYLDAYYVCYVVVMYTYLFSGTNSRPNSTLPGNFNDFSFSGQACVAFLMQYKGGNR